MKNLRLTIVGILNITPDSFSDGGDFFKSDQARLQAEHLLASGATLLDIGADSTRPGSVCCGVEEEQRRIREFFNASKCMAPFFIDTHNAQTAKLALSFGAMGINDVSAGSDPQMFELAASNACKLVLMYSRCTAPHLFGPELCGNLTTQISAWLQKRADLALRSGVLKENIILDPGMGAFISTDPARSFGLLDNLATFGELGYDLMLGISRKGFVAPDLKPGERDYHSYLITKKVLTDWPGKHMLYLRVHAPEFYREFI